MRCLFLVVNNACNLRCAYCFYNTGYQSRTSASICDGDVSLLSQKITALGFSTVIMTGGDPFYSEKKQQTFDLIREMKGRRLKVIVNTSGALLNDRDLDDIVALGVDRMDISIDSHDPVIHNGQRGRHEDAVFAIKGLLERNYRSVATTTVITENNASTVKETVKWLRELGVKDTRMQIVFDPKRKGVMPAESILDAFREAESLLEAAHTQDYILITQSAFLQKKPSSRACCRMGKNYFVCDPEGKLAPCFHRPDIDLGNLFTDDAGKIEKNIENDGLCGKDMPECFGTHCVSLFDNPMFWKII